MKQFSFNRLEIVRNFFIRLSSKIRTGFLISEKLSDLWPVFDDFVVKNTNFDFKLTQMYQYNQHFENQIPVLLDLFIINKINFFLSYSKHNCMQSSSTKFCMLLMMNKSNKI